MLEKIKKYYHFKKFDKALLIAKREYKKFPNNLEYAYLLGLIYYALDKFSASNKYLNLFLEHNPYQTDALIARMHCLRSMNRNDEAITILTKLLELDTRKSDIHLFLGECYLKLSRIEIAKKHFNKSYEIDSSKTNVLNIFKIYSDCNYREEASMILKKSSIFKKDDDIVLKYCTNQLVYNLKSFEEVHKLLVQLIKKNITNSKINNLLGISSLILGRIRDAKNYFLKSIDLFQNNSDDILSSISYVASSYYQLAKMNYQFDNRKIDELKHILDQSKNNDVKALLGYALSKIFENGNNFEKSAKILKSSNKNIFKNIILQKGWRFEEELVFFENLKRIYLTLKNKSKLSNYSIRPIFILGMPRSGTTLVENILSQSHLIEPTGENSFILKNIFNLFPMIKKKIIDPENYSLHFNSEFIQKYFNFLSPKKKIITDKTPLNFLILGIIKILIPNSKIIYCKRNSNDNITSLFQTFFHSYAHEYSYDLNSLKDYYELHNEAIVYWNSQKIDFFTLSYEKLISNNEENIKKICSFVEIDFSRNMLQPHLSKRNVYTASSYQVRQPINSSSINKWKNYMQYFK